MDYEISKKAYWDCELCLKYGSGRNCNTGRGMLWQYSTIFAHVKQKHGFKSLEKYKDVLEKYDSSKECQTLRNRGEICEKSTSTVSTPDISNRNLRPQNSTKNFAELHKGTWECRICNKHFKTHQRSMTT